MVAKHVAVKLAGPNPVDSVLWIPVPFLIGDDERAIAIDADTVGGTEAVGDDFSLLAVSADF